MINMTNLIIENCLEGQRWHEGDRPSAQTTGDNYVEWINEWEVREAECDHMWSSDVESSIWGGQTLYSLGSVQLSHRLYRF